MNSRPAPSLSLRILIGFTALYTATAWIWALSQGNREFIFYLAVLPLIVFLIGYLHGKLRFTLGLLWSLSLLGLLHMLGGLVVLSRGAQTEGKRLLYNLWLVEGVLKYDHVVHTVGSGLATWFCWQTLRRMAGGNWLWRNKRPKQEMLLICALAGFGVGSVNEVMEFLATRMMDATNVGGYVNNALDLVANLAGVAIAGVLLRWNEVPDEK